MRPVEKRRRWEGLPEAVLVLGIFLATLYLVPLCLRWKDDRDRKAYEAWKRYTGKEMSYEDWEILQSKRLLNVED